MRRLAELYVGFWFVCAAGSFPSAQTLPFTSDFPLRGCHFSTFGGRPYFPLDPGRRLVLAGEEDGKVELVITVLNDTKEIGLPAGDGRRFITARVIEEREFLDGALVEVARHYYGRCVETGDVYYFGEQADQYEQGATVSHVGSWEAGVDGASPGILMPGTFLLGARYFQEQAPGVVMDQAENVGMGLTMATPLGAYGGCVRVLEYDGFKPETDPSVKVYAPDIGLINDDVLELQDVEIGSVGLPAGARFIPFSDHPHFPVLPGMRWEFQGAANSDRIERIARVLDETRTLSVRVAGESAVVETALLESRETVNGKLRGVTRDWLAQCIETRDVWSLGREVESYENGELVGTDGSWIAGEAGATPAIRMPGYPALGTRFRRTRTAGIPTAEASVAQTNAEITTLWGAFGHCVRIAEARVEDGRDETVVETFAPGIGLVAVGDSLSLTSFSPGPAASNQPLLSVEDALIISWPAADQGFQVESSEGFDDWKLEREEPSLTDGRFRIAVPKSALRRFFRLTKPPQ